MAKIPKFTLLFGAIILFSYFLLRLPNLTMQPIFADEAIYIRWAQVMRAEPTLRFLPLSDGKTPLFMWLMMPMLKIINDPLLAGRLLSTVSGLVTLVGVLAVGYRFFSARVGLWAAFIYAVTPYAVFFDRMALVDSMLAAFTIWSIFLSLLLVKTPRLDLAMILGYMLGGGLLVKTPAMMNLLVMPTTFLAAGFKVSQRQKVFRLLTFWLIALVIAVIAYNLLRLGPGFQQLSTRNADYVFSPLELKGRPLDPLLPHFNDLKDWFPKLFTVPILLLVGVGIFFSFKNLSRIGIVLFIWALIPLLLQSAFLKTFTARYLLFSIPPLIVLAGFGLDHLLSKFQLKIWLKLLLAIMLILPLPLYFNFLLLTKPEIAPLPRAERRGYLEDWTAGYGFKEIAQFLVEENKKQPVVVGTEGYFGTLPDGLHIYLDKAGISIIGSGATISASLRDAARRNSVYFIGNKNRLPKYLDNTTLIKEYPKAVPLDGNPQDAIMVYQVFPK